MAGFQTYDFINRAIPVLDDYGTHRVSDQEMPWNKTHANGGHSTVTNGANLNKRRPTSFFLIFTKQASVGTDRTLEVKALFVTLFSIFRISKQLEVNNSVTPLPLASSNLAFQL